MRILQLHCDSIEYTPTKKEIKNAEEDVSAETTRLEELVVAFVAVEKEDDSSVAALSPPMKTVSLFTSPMMQVIIPGPYGRPNLVLYSRGIPAPSDG